jgi:methionine-rich copper-binding protein CopC
VLTIAASSMSNELSTAADLAPGQYTLRWQALALDGHITRGDLPFTVVPKQ